MTLDEARDMRLYWLREQRKVGWGSPRHNECFGNWQKYNNIVCRLLKSPTQQLCAVALEICKEDLTEKGAAM